jgi:hypothetical protein
MSWAAEELWASFVLNVWASFNKTREGFGPI